MELLVAIAAAVFVSVGIVLTRRPRAELPPWTGFVEQWISDEMSSIEGTVEGHAVQAAVVYGERSFCKLRIDVRTLMEPRWRFGANLRTGKVMAHVEHKSLAFLSGSTPTIRDDLVVDIREGTAELDLPFRDTREIYSTVLEVIALVERIAAAASADALSQAFHSGETVSESERWLMLLIAMHPDNQATSEAVELCASSGEPLLELGAARCFEGERKKALLFRLVEGKHVPDGVRAEAISLLEPFLDADRAHTIALPILDGSASLSRRAALRLLARFPLAEVPERLVEIAQHVQDLGTAIDLVTTLSIIGGDRAVRALEHLLGFGDVQQETLAALARLGDRRTLGAIHEHLDRLEHNGLRDAAAHAIEQIRERLGAPDGGRLSLVDPSASGELSVIEQAGDLGLADD